MAYFWHFLAKTAISALGPSHFYFLTFDVMNNNQVRSLGWVIFSHFLTFWVKNKPYVKPHYSDTLFFPCHNVAWFSSFADIKSSNFTSLHLWMLPKFICCYFESHLGIKNPKYFFQSRLSGRITLAIFSHLKQPTTQISL